MMAAKHGSSADFMAQFDHAIDRNMGTESSPLKGSAIAAGSQSTIQIPAQALASDVQGEINPQTRKTATSETRPAPARKRDGDAQTNSAAKSAQLNTAAAIPVILSAMPDASQTAVSDESAEQGSASALASGQQPVESASLPAAPLAATQPAASEKAPMAAGTGAPLSFAAKIQASNAGQSGNSSQRNILNDNVGAVASAWKKAQKDGQQPEPGDAPTLASPAPGASLNTFGAAAPLMAPLAPTIAPAPKEAAVSAARALEAPAPILQHETAATGQLKDVSFRIPQADGSSIQLRLTQQSGELKLAVHTASADLNQGLRDSLPDLTKKLSDSGVHAETWRPGISSAPAEAQANTSGNSGGNAYGGNSQNQSGSGQQGGARRDQEQSSRPQWVEELENGIQSTSSFPMTGDFHGFIN
jgi:hypothetical protein